MSEPMYPTASVDARWDVEVFKGAAGVDVVNAPVRFGTTSITLDQDGASEPGVPLIYGPVGLRSADDWLCMEVEIQLTQSEFDRQIRECGGVNIGTRIVRTMQHVHRVSFDEWDGIRIFGLEEKSDGTAVFAIWRAWPHALNDGQST